MGLFDTGIQVGSGYQELADKLAGGLEKHTGYVSPQTQLRRAVSQTDLSDSDSVQKTFQMLMQKSPQDAVQWLNSIKPIITANIEQEKLALSAKKGTGTPENQAKAQLRAELIDQHGTVEGNRIFMERMQQSKEDVQAAGIARNTGLTLFKDATKAREQTRSKISTIKTAMNTFKQAKAGSGAAAKLSENVITNVFDGSAAKAASEITRIASAGGFIENIGDFVNEALTGVKTQEHYDAFLKVLDIYAKEQESSYNRQTKYMYGLNQDYELKVPDSVFEMAGPKRRKWNPKTGTVE